MSAAEGQERMAREQSFDPKKVFIMSQVAHITTIEE
jgi:hypothetical protein